MSETPLEDAHDPAVEKLKSSRENSATLKIRLMRLRERCPNMPVFVFEGVDDKIIYGAWVRRINPEFYYEPFLCSGKKGVLRLKKSTEVDLNGLENDVYFFVDRDFDDLQGHSPDSNLFMTDQYSVENYLVTRSVLDDLLKNEFSCHSNPDARKEICTLFEHVYASFLAQTKEANRRIFVARKIGAKIVPSIPSKIKAIVLISLENVESSAYPIEEAVCIEPEPSFEEWKRFTAEFDQLNPSSRYRGKFALQFFATWLSSLCTELNKHSSSIFPSYEKFHAPRLPQDLLSPLASKSEYPCLLPAFLEKAASSFRT
ncbi:DUF4435 domain-containing protein [Roseomonas gilardii]|uniref:DUF4435 domain-containing protein n=1 Tax=Roseomonas gilardii TaxID=257708 RepID=UPI0011A372BF|nr:DUF4435 domain-containing protein [Roseomonas gilardii]